MKQWCTVFSDTNPSSKSCPANSYFPCQRESVDYLSSELILFNSVSLSLALLLLLPCPSHSFYSFLVPRPPSTPAHPSGRFSPPPYPSSCRPPPTFLLVATFLAAVVFAISHTHTTHTHTHAHTHRHSHTYYTHTATTGPCGCMRPSPFRSA